MSFCRFCYFSVAFAIAGHGVLWCYLAFMVVALVTALFRIACLHTCGSAPDYCG